MSDAWISLRRLTSARIALGNAGAGLPTQEHLSFQLAHARARDAVALRLDVPALVHQLEQIRPNVLHARTQANDRVKYLADPAAGGRLDVDASAALSRSSCDVAFIIADGLSAGAVQQHAAPVLQRVLSNMLGDWNVAPFVVVTGGRVAIGDEIGQRLGVRIAAVLIGERPGLSAPDSMGIYVTYAPAPGRTNAERNCISNIRPDGLDYDAAASKLLLLLNEARRLRLTGVALKEPG